MVNKAAGSERHGAVFFNQSKNILIVFLAAWSVVQGEMTLGMMMATLFILGQANSPIEQMISFLRSAQDARISIERLGEIHQRQDEEDPDQHRITIIPENKSIAFHNLSFQYEGPHSEMVLQDISCHIPENKVTAIVGPSGSGKTTMVKLMLGFYPPVKGDIRVGDTNLLTMSSRTWRQHVGAVMQDGFIFSDTIANNIAVSKLSTL